MDPDESEASVSSPAHTTFMNLFAESAQVTGNARESNDEVFCRSNLIMKAKTRVETKDRQKGIANKCSAILQKRENDRKFREKTSLEETATARPTCRDAGSKKAFPQIEALVQQPHR